jgi:hypothetical protein
MEDTSLDLFGHLKGPFGENDRDIEDTSLDLFEHLKGPLKENTDDVDVELEQIEVAVDILNDELPTIIIKDRLEIITNQLELENITDSQWSSEETVSDIDMDIDVDAELEQIEVADDLSNEEEPLELENIKEPLELENIKEPLELENIKEPLELANIEEPLELENIKEPLELENIKEPLELANIKEPLELANVEEPLLIVEENSSAGELAIQLNQIVTDESIDVGLTLITKLIKMKMTNSLDLPSGYLNEQLQLEVDADVELFILKILDEHVDFCQKLQDCLRNIVKDNKIDSYDIPSIIELLTKMFAIIYNNKTKKIDATKATKICGLFIKLTFFLLIETGEIKIDKSSHQEILEKMTKLVDSCITLIHLTRNLRPKTWLDKFNHFINL